MKSLKIDMCAGSQLRDTQGETLDIEGADISELEAGRGRLNDNHGKGFFNTLGKITAAKKIFKAEDCENDRHRYYWEKVKSPYIYVAGELFNDEDHPNSKAAAAILRNVYKTDCPLKVKSSVEGGVVSRGLRDPSHLARTKIHSVALTFVPANQATLVEPLNLDKSSYDHDADMVLIKSVLHLAETNVPSFRHIVRNASAEKIEVNINKIMASLGKKVALELKQELIKDSLRNKISENVHLINELVKSAVEEEMDKKELDPGLGYTFSHEHHDLGDGEMLTHIRAHHPNGTVAGEALFNHRPNKMLEAEGVKVHPEHQRLGLASAIYNHAQKVTNKPIMPSTDQTAAGKAFWSGTKGNFGNPALNKAVPGPDEDYYNVKQGYTGKDARAAQINAVKQMVNRHGKFHKPFKTMVNEKTGKPELHMMVHRGIDGPVTDPTPTSKNKFKVTPTHIEQPGHAVHAMSYGAAHEYTGRELDPPETAEGKWIGETWVPARKPDPERAHPESGIYSMWVPVSQIESTGDYMARRFKNPNMPLPEGENDRRALANNSHAFEQGHITIKPGRYARVTKTEMQAMHNRWHKNFKKRNPDEWLVHHEKYPPLSPQFKHIYPDDPQEKLSYTKGKTMEKALTAGYGGAGAPTAMSGGSVLQSESQELGPKSFKYITCDDCGNEQIYGKFQVKCRNCNKTFSMKKLEKFFQINKKG
jgi:GNAT superfamily N-acetyltransferase